MRFTRFSLLLLLLATSWAYGIVGGVPASATDAPGVVTLVDVSRPDDAACAGSEVFCKQYCAGLLIAPRWVLTAAHCANNGIITGNIRVIAGTTDLYSADPASAIAVLEKFVHPQYGIAADFDADIALLKLDRDLSLPLASLVETQSFTALLAEAPLRNDEVRASGWGRLSSTGGFPKTLRRVDIDLQQDSLCLDKFNQLSVVRYISASMLCVMEDAPGLIEMDDASDPSPYDADGEGVCNYDSGGPLSYFANGFWQVIGVTSFAPKGDCASSSLPSVSTRLLPYIPWIEQTTRLAGYNLGDLALTLSGTTDYSPGQVATITVSLTNAGAPSSGSTPLDGAGFTVSVPEATGLSVVGVPSGINCVVISSGQQCTSTASLAAGASRTVSFSIAVAAGEQQANVSVVANNAGSNGLMDYRQGNNQREMRILFGVHPDLQLTLDGFTSELVNTTATSTDGRAWLMGHLQNRSTRVVANNVQLRVALPAGYIWEGWEGITECASQACNLASLAPGEIRDFRVRLLATGATSATVSLTVTSTDGDFPVTLSGHPDAEADLLVSFNVLHLPEEEVVIPDVVTPPDEVVPPGTIKNLDSGGAIGLPELIFLMLSGGYFQWRRTRRRCLAG